MIIRTWQDKGKKNIEEKRMTKTLFSFYYININYNKSLIINDNTNDNEFKKFLRIKREIEKIGSKQY